jgi:hypothetical protein
MGVPAPIIYGAAAGGFTFATVRPSAKLVMSWSDANAEISLVHTLLSLAGVRRTNEIKCVKASR